MKLYTYATMHVYIYACISAKIYIFAYVRYVACISV